MNRLGARATGTGGRYGKKEFWARWAAAKLWVSPWPPADGNGMRQAQKIRQEGDLIAAEFWRVLGGLTAMHTGFFCRLFISGRPSIWNSGTILREKIAQVASKSDAAPV